jgi:hypothetical protein
LFLKGTKTRKPSDPRSQPDFYQQPPAAPIAALTTEEAAGSSDDVNDSVDILTFNRHKTSSEAPLRRQPHEAPSGHNNTVVGPSVTNNKNVLASGRPERYSVTTDPLVDANSTLPYLLSQLIRQQHFPPPLTENPYHLQHATAASSYDALRALINQLRQIEQAVNAVHAEPRIGFPCWDRRDTASPSVRNWKGKNTIMITPDNVPSFSSNYVVPK